MFAPASRQAQAILYMLLAVSVFSFMDAVAKTMAQHYHPMQVVWSRYTGQVVVVLCLIAPKLLQYLRTAHLGSHLIRSVCQFGATAFFFLAMPYIGLAEATAIADINPVLITLGAAVFLGEKLGPRRLAGVLAALIGALIIIRPGSGVFGWAALLPLACAVCYTANALITRKMGAKDPVWTALIYAALTGSVITTATLPTVWTPVASEHLLVFLSIGLIGSVGQLFMIRAFITGEAAVIAPFAYVGLLCATFWGWLFFGEMPDLWTGVGALVIVVSGIYVWHRETRSAQGRD
ncbi:DMT family transporter [Falsigemmobacter intermedius]|uniref:DMT family transporter n=1 Tax=Falsigemmobacter intermedius TaxID=1553448 RepID=A0A444MBK0_9RHOB|nr:DMT family transporter [Falsigemmobacter intermedius]RWY41108.1 DMT family transporter [Falsigemmobacter intermedius]